MRRLVGLLVVIWLAIGVVAVVQRGYFGSSPQNCAGGEFLMAMAKWRNHPYLELEGEALDNHMMAMHGWSMQMMAVKGTQTLAQKHNYIGAMHLKEPVSYTHLRAHETGR